MKKTMNNAQAITFEMAQMLNDTPDFNLWASFENITESTGSMINITDAELNSMSDTELNTLYWAVSKEISLAEGATEDALIKTLFAIIAIEDERFEQSGARARLIAWLNDPANEDDIEYSDIYKDVYGVRP